jgi:hypothetical protein
MNTFLYVLLALVASGLAYLLIRVVRSTRLYFKFLGKSLVNCPETQQPAAVEVDAKRLFRESVTGVPHFRLSECSRWPEREACGQECLQQIQSAPGDCLVRNIVAQWYAKRTCVYCGKPILDSDWLNQIPALLGPDRKTVEWKQVRPETLPQVLATYVPVCWSCHVTETFRRDHPDLVVERPWRG